MSPAPPYPPFRCSPCTATTEPPNHTDCLVNSRINVYWKAIRRAPISAGSICCAVRGYRREWEMRLMLAINIKLEVCMEGCINRKELSMHAWRCVLKSWCNGWEENFRLGWLILTSFADLLLAIPAQIRHCSRSDALLLGGDCTKSGLYRGRNTLLLQERTAKTTFI